MGEVPRTSRGAPTSKDVAALAGVAQSTVSYVMNGRPVGADTRRRVEDAMRKLRYQPNAGARSLRTAKSRVIALIVHLEAQDDASETVPYIDTIVAEAERRDYDVILSTTRSGSESITRLARRGICDAFVLMDVETTDERVATVAELGLPAVLVGRPADPRGLDVVDLDTWRTGEVLVEELARTGHRHVAMLGESDSSGVGFQFIRDFHDGARTRALALGIDLDIITRADETWESALAVAPRLLAHREDRLGIIARTPRDTQWIMNLCQLEGLVPGQDLSVVSRCTDDVAVALVPPVTNVSPQPRGVSEVAMGFLFDRIEGDEQPARLRLIEPGNVVRRQTTVEYPQR